MRTYWSRIPMLRVALGMLAGIGFEIFIHSKTQNNAVLIAPITFFMLSLLWVLGSATVKSPAAIYRLRLVTGLSLHGLIISSAFLFAWFYAQQNYRNHFSHALHDKNVLVVTVAWPPSLRNKIVLVNAEVNEVNNDAGCYFTTGKIRLSITRDTASEKLAYGDELLIKSHVDTIAPPQNPSEFDYRAWLQARNINYQSFVTGGNWQLTGTNRGNALLAGIYSIRNNFLQVLQHQVKDKNNLAIAAALLLGYRDFMNPDIKQAYANSGVIYVLSVSGMHVAVMLFMLSFLLQWMDKRSRALALARALLVITFIWCYAALTGFNPPVLRAALIFTLKQLGDTFSKSRNTHNTLAASAVLFMFADPFIICDAGFQLGYLAVLGIIYLQPKIANLYSLPDAGKPQFKNFSNPLRRLSALFQYDLKWSIIKIAGYFWQLLAASAAAQIAILPLTLYYFYQFPNLFLLSGLVVIPVCNLLLFTGILLFVFAPVPALGTLIISVFNLLLSCLNKFILWLNSLPVAITKGICITAAEMLLLYLLIFLLCWLTEERRNRVLISALTVLLILCTLSSYKKFEQHGQRQVVVYAVPRQKAMVFISDHALFYEMDSSLLNDENRMQQHIYRHWWNAGITEKTALTDSTNRLFISIKRIEQGQLILFEGKKILVVDSLSSASYEGAKSKLQTELVIFSGTPKVSLPVLAKSIAFDEAVFDSSTKPAARKRWKKDCANLNITCWDVNTDGAFVWKLN